MSFESTAALRARFAAALSEMYGREVPAYRTLVEVAGEVNTAAAGESTTRLGGIDRVTAERHGAIRVGTPHEVATEVSLNTAFGVERIVREAFARAAKRRKHLTLAHKTNVLSYAGKLWSRIVEEVGREYPDVEVGYQHIDAMMIHLVTDPSRFDVIVTDNLFGDIITDLAGAVCGGIGLAASGNIDATKTNPSMFEPVHGSAPDIAGQGIADPTAAIMSVALLLSHLGENAAAARVDKAVEEHLATRGDAKLSTTEAAERILGLL